MKEQHLEQKLRISERFFVFPGPPARPQFVFYWPRPSVYIYPAMVYMRKGNNKIQSLDIVLLFLFMSNPFVTVVVDWNETKGRLKVNELMQIWIENLLVSASSHKNNMPKILHCNTVSFLR